MCTLIAFHRPRPRVHLVVAANRDEYLDRPTRGLELDRIGGRGVLAPRDLRAGGTWLGLNDLGVFAALTNRPNPSPEASRPSRGLLVTAALAQASARGAAELLAALPDRAYNPFNLFVADGEQAFVAVYEGSARVTELAPGAHLIGNADPNDRSVPKVDRLLQAAERVAAGAPEDWLDGLADVCRSHAGDTPLAAACVHQGGYGTRSSLLLRLEAERSRSELRWSDGAPCRSRYRNLTPLLHELPRAGALAEAGGSPGSVA